MLAYTLPCLSVGSSVRSSVTFLELQAFFCIIAPAHVRTCTPQTHTLTNKNTQNRARPGGKICLYNSWLMRYRPTDGLSN